MQRTYSEVQAQANRIRDMVHARITSTLRQAGLDWSTHHNAMVGLHYGEPWRGVDYSLARKAQWLIDTKLWAAQRIVDRWYSKQPCGFAWCDGTDGICRRAAEMRAALV